MEQQTVLDHLARFLTEQGLSELSDAGLLERFVARHDDAAFAVLVRRHGPLVLGLCRRVLGQAQDAEDAFQAAFLVLARRADSLRQRQSLGGWLYGVAYRVARKARTAAARRRRHERRAGLTRPEQGAEQGERVERIALLDEELARLPERFREPLILCYLDGLTQQEAARRLSLLPRTLKARLERGRGLLRQALERRGAGAVAGLLALPPVAVPGELAGSIARHAALFATRSAARGEIPASVLALAEGASGTASLPRACGVLLVLLVLGGLALGIGSTPAPPVAARKAAPPVEEPRVAVAERVDRHGDPLPEGALARLGTVRLRQGGLIFQALLSRDGKLLLTVGDDLVARLWDARMGKPVREFVSRTRERNTLYCAALSPDGKRLAYATACEMETFDVETGKRLMGWSISRVENQQEHGI